MYKLLTYSSITMLIGGIIATSSAAMYGFGKLFFDSKIRCLKDAPEIRNTSESGFGYLQGPLHSDTPIQHNDKGYIRLDQSVFHITTTKIIGYDLNHNEKKSEFKNKSEFVHRTAKQTKPITLNNVDIGVFIKSVPLKFINSEFVPIEAYIAQNSRNEHVTNVNVGRIHSNDNHILGEHEKKVIGVEYQWSGIKVGKVYTIFGYFDADRQKMKKSEKFYNIITKQSRDELIEHEESFSRRWKCIWGAGIDSKFPSSETRSQLLPH